MKRTSMTQRLAQALIVSITLATIAPPSFAGLGIYGGGNCSIWAGIKGKLFGVHCGYY